MKRLVMVVVLAWAALALPRSGACDPASDEDRLRARLDPETARAVIELVHSAREARLPSAPLVSRAFQGASLGASGATIRAAVQDELEALTSARAALGDSSDANELVAGAMALLSGAPADTLARLRASRPRQSLVVPLIVISDLIARRVPIASASTTVITATRAGARDSDLLKLREHVERELEKGTPPAGAAGDGLRLFMRDAARARAGPDAARPAVPYPAAPGGSKP